MTIPIVVVDDDDADRYILKRVIKSLGIDAKLFEFEDGVPFVEIVRDRDRLSREIGDPPPPILVLLDINMPRMDGFEVLEQMEAALNNDDLVMFVTMYSSSNQGQERADAEKYPFVKGFIVKPVTAEKLDNLLRELYPPD